jgi:hypothetical protein
MKSAVLKLHHYSASQANFINYCFQASFNILASKPLLGNLKEAYEK